MQDDELEARLRAEEAAEALVDKAHAGSVLFLPVKNGPKPGQWARWDAIYRITPPADARPGSEAIEVVLGSINRTLTARYPSYRDAWMSLMQGLALEFVKSATGREAAVDGSPLPTPNVPGSGRA